MNKRDRYLIYLYLLGLAALLVLRDNLILFYSFSVAFEL